MDHAVKFLGKLRELNNRIAGVPSLIFFFLPKVPILSQKLSSLSSFFGVIGWGDLGRGDAMLELGPGAKARGIDAVANREITKSHVLLGPLHRTRKPFLINYFQTFKKEKNLYKITEVYNKTGLNRIFF